MPKKKELNLRYRIVNFNAPPAIMRGFQALSGKAGKKSKLTKKRK